MIKGLKDEFKLVAQGTPVEEMSVMMMHTDSKQVVYVQDIEPLYDDIYIARYTVDEPGNWLVVVQIGEYVENLSVRISEDPDWFAQAKIKRMGIATNAKAALMHKELRRSKVTENKR